MKKIVISVICFTMIFTFFGCGSSAVTNEEAGNAVKSALEARWAYQEENEKDITTKNAGDEYLAIINEELTPIAEYKEAEFEDDAVGNAVKEYISVLEKQRGLYEKYNGDYWTQEYNNLIYRLQRQNALKTIVEKTGITFSGKSKEHFNSMMDDSEFDNLKDDAEIVDQAFTIEDTKAENDEWGDVEAGFKVKNNTGYTFPEFAIIYRVKTSDGTTAESEEYAYIENFEAGSTAWTEDAGYNLEDERTIEAYAYIAGIEDGYIYNEVDLDETIVIKKD